MTAVVPGSIEIRYEGQSLAGELWGMTQANFAIAEPGRHAREVAVQVKDAALAHAATALGVENSPALRTEMARRLGETILRRLASAGRPIDPLTTVSRRTIEQDPGLLQEAQAASLPGA